MRRWLSNAIVVAVMVAAIGAGVSMMRRYEPTARPVDANTWADRGATLLDTGQPQPAIAAFRNAARMAPQTASHWSSLGEALAATGGATVPAEARTAFRRALALDPLDQRARYFLALARAGDGDPAGAIDDWLALVAAMPRGTPWEADVVRQIERTGAAHRIAVAGRIAAARTRSRAVPPLALPPG